MSMAKEGLSSLGTSIHLPPVPIFQHKLKLMFLADNCAWQKGCAPFTAQSNAYIPNVGGVLMITSFGSRTTRINKSIN